MNDRYVFDLDDTLIMTTELNNTSYNMLLQSYQTPIIASTRITRDVVFNNYSNLTELQKNEIVKLKQFYFMENIHCTRPNTN
jgi:phosphoglycolate phosphatase-like HAD superfamily hydrolase